MIDTWKDAFTIVGGFVATSATAVTIFRRDTSKPVMDKQSDNSEFRATLAALMDSFNKSQIAFAEMKRDQAHAMERMEDIGRKREEDHKLLKKLDKILMPLLKNEIESEYRARGLSTDTETGEI